MDNDVIEQLEHPKLLPAKKDEMKKTAAKLKELGKEWRKDHAARDKDGKIKRLFHVPLREIADMIENNLTFARVVDRIESRKDRATAPLMFQDKDEGIYIHDTALLLDLINKVERNTDENGAKKVLYWLLRDSDYKQRTKAKYLVPVGNGVYNRNTDQLESYENYVFTSKVCTDYVNNPTVPSLNGWRIDKWIENDICENNPEKETLFWQAAYCIANPSDNKKGSLMFVDDGRGNTGKGTVQELFTQLVGVDNRANLSIEEFEDDFKIAEAVNAALIVGDDNNPNSYIKDSRKLKSIIAKENILINPKFEKPFSFTITAFSIQSMNGMSRFKDTSEALYDRFRVLKFNKRYEDNEVDLNVKDKYVRDKRVLEWVLYKALHVKPFSRLIKTQESNQIIHDSQINGDPVREFISEHMGEFKSTAIPSAALFNIFRTVYQSENGKATQLSQRAFTAHAKALTPKHGWSYEKDTRVKDGWNEADKEYFMHRYDVNYLRGMGNGYSYPFTVSHNDKGVFVKTENR